MTLPVTLPKLRMKMQVKGATMEWRRSALTTLPLPPVGMQSCRLHLSCFHNIFLLQSGRSTMPQIAEGCAKVMLKNLEQVVSMIMNGFQHPHPRVRWAAINAIGELSTDLGPDLQVQYHHKVLPALANALQLVRELSAAAEVVVRRPLCRSHPQEEGLSQ